MTPYRTSERDRKTDDAVEDLATLDVSGARGADAAFGPTGRDGVYEGEPGGDGGDAGAAHPGQPGGTIAAKLERRGLDEVAVSARLLYPGGSARVVEHTVVPGNEGDIVFLARGGRGGAGARGGEGGTGGTGKAGRDATRYSSGGTAARVATVATEAEARAAPMAAMEAMEARWRSRSGRAIPTF